MKRHLWIACAASAVLLASAQATAAQAGGDKRASKDKKTAADRGLMEDKGRFRLLVDGQQVGTEEFHIAPDGTGWSARGKAELKAGAASAQVSAQLRLAAEGAPVTYECVTQSNRKDTVTVAFNGSVARMDLQTEGSQPFTQEMTFDTGPVIILDNNMYHHYAILARLYDWQAKGEQSFAVLIPQDQVPGSITVKAGGPQEVDGTRYEVLRVQTSDLVVDLFLDPSRRLMRLTVADSKVEVVRDKSS